MSFTKLDESPFYHSVGKYKRTTYFMYLFKNNGSSLPWLWKGHVVPGCSLAVSGRTRLSRSIVCSDRCPVLELLDRGFSLGLLALEVSQGFLLEVDLFPFFHNTKVAR